MEIFKEIEPLKAYLQAKRSAKLSVGLVPTMGALHQGHLTLIRAAFSENNLIVATIYVNPTQFNNASDLDKYPRSLEADIKMLEKENCHALFMPSDLEMYSDTQYLKFDFGDLDKVMEGRFRPGHFSGVALVVSKLFNIVQPDRAYFGQKDYQQFQIIQRLVTELKFPVELRSVPIVRDPTGLALSSRNQRLNEADLKKATLLHECLVYAKDKLGQGEEFDLIKREVSQKFNEDEGLELEYLELADKMTLGPLEKNTHPNQGILLIAAYINGVRLIDNMILDQ